VIADGKLIHSKLGGDGFPRRPTDVCTAIRKSQSEQQQVVDLSGVEVTTDTQSKKLSEKTQLLNPPEDDEPRKSWCTECIIA